MRSQLLILFFLLYGSSYGFGQVGFAKAYIDTVNAGTKMLDLTIDADTIVIYGTNYSALVGYQGVRFMKMDTFGHILTEKFHYDTSVVLSTYVFRKEIIQTSDGGYAIAGTAVTNPQSIYLMKVHHDLSLDFVKRLSTDIWTGGSTLMETPSGYLIIGVLNGILDGQIEVIKTDLNGNQLWRKFYGESGFLEAGLSITFFDGRIIISGSKSPYNGIDPVPYSLAYLLEIDSAGNKVDEWESDQSIDGIFGIVFLQDGSKVCSSATWEYNPNVGGYHGRPLVFRLDKDNNLVWKKLLGEPDGRSGFRDIVATHDGHFIASGYTDSENPFGRRAVHYKFTGDGDSLWLRYDSAFVDGGGVFYPETMVTGTQLLSSGSVVSVGHTYKETANGTAVFGFVMKISPDGCMDTLNCWPVANEDMFLLDEDRLSVYPNPAFDQVHFNVKNTVLSRNSIIEISDMLGRRVGVLTAIKNEQNWSLEGVSSGVYNVRLIVDDVVLDVKRLLVE